MAEAILFGVTDGILQKLGILALQEVGLIWGVKDELQKLRNTVSVIKAVLLDAEEQQAARHEVRDWLQKLKDAFYDADDLLDEFSTVALQKMMMMQETNSKKVRSFFLKANNIAYGYKMAYRIKGIRERLDDIAADKSKYHFTDCCRNIPAVKMEREQSHSFVCLEEVVGREEDKIALVRLLLHSNAQENVSVIPIVGIGGLGKTTLAQVVYNDEKVQRHFELKVWVCVSDVFDVKLIAQKILESATSGRYENCEMDYLSSCIRKELDGKKYLLVLDDVWNDNRERWLKLRHLLMGGARGSKIVVTTRTLLTATITGTTEPYFLKGLSKDKSWSLFKKSAWKEGQELEHPRLVSIGQEIVEKCAGVPLAIRTMGSLLYCKDTEMEWLSFKDSDLSKIIQNENDILPILKLSYEQLPSCLKQCFAYCSLFPKDYEINKQMLIKLWMAQGFIQRENGMHHLEDVGHHYFMDLLRRSFFQVVEYDQWGNVISCKMHDLMHDLAQLVGGNDIFTVGLDVRNIGERIRHVSLDLVLDSSQKIPASLFKAGKLRTFMLPLQPIHRKILYKAPHDAIISTFRGLRVLDFHNTGLDIVPSSISKLKHLRYLDLSNNGIKTLPCSIIRLQNLQTLKLSACKRLEALPKDIGKLANLKHIEVDQCIGLIYMPSGLGQLAHLHTLSQFVVGSSDSASKHCGSLGELKGLNNLRGELTIAKLENLKNVERESKQANMKEKQNLEVLRLEWSREVDRHEMIDDDEVLLKGLRPHSNLKEFHIYGYRGSKFPRWVRCELSTWLPNLLEIIIWRCYRCLQLPLFGQLPMLKVLKLEEVTDAELIENNNEEFMSSIPKSNLFAAGEAGESKVFFPSLKELRFFDLRNLKGWWREEVSTVKQRGATEGTKAETATARVGPALATPVGAEKHPVKKQRAVPWFPCLSKLTIGHCPKLKTMPFHPFLEELEFKDVSASLVQRSMGMVASIKGSSTGAAPHKLKHLYMDSILDVFSLSEFRLPPSLERLSIENCPNLSSLDGESLRDLSSLSFLSISGCGGLMSLSPGLKHLTALEELELKDCRELDLSNCDEVFQGLKSLCRLRIENIPKMVSLPDGIQLVNSLKDLRIRGCSGLKGLPEWIHNLLSLQRLEISDCPNLTSLPRGMGCAKQVQILDICGCPQLLGRSQSRVCMEYPEIPHIPHIYVDRKKMDTTGWLSH